MKTLLTTIYMVAMLSGGDKYEKNMTANIESLYAATTVEELQAVANKFERISSVEKTEWLPGYYASLAYIWMATRESDTTQKDKWLDQAQLMLDVAVAVDSENAEMLTLQGFIHMMRITVDPAARGATFSPKASQAMAMAVNMDPNNPRAMFFKGQMDLGTAQFFNADTSPACETMTRSLELFANFTPETLLHPNWGEAYARAVVGQCNEDGN